MTGPARSRWLAVGLVAVACAPLVAIVARLVVEGWVPTDDDAVIAVLADEVFSWDSPALGMRSTVGDGSGHHPGPLLFWALAPLVELSGSAPWSLLVGVAAVGAASVVAVAVSARRVAGTGGLVAALVVTTVMALSLGRKVLVDPWNPHAAVLPFLASLFLVFGVGAGWSWGLPFAALALSFAAQAHVVYLPFAAVLLAAGALTVLRGPRPVAPLAVTGGALLVTWSLPLLEQLTNDDGNLGRLAGAADVQDGSAPIGWGYAARAVARTIGAPPTWVVPARRDVLFEPVPVVVGVTAAAVLVGLVALAVVAWRRRDRVVVAAVGVALLGLAVALPVVARLPVFAGFTIPLWRAYVLWPLGAFCWFTLILGVARLARLEAPVRRATVVVGAAIVVVAAVAAPFADSTMQEPPGAQAAVRELAPEITSPVAEVGPLRVVSRGTMALETRYGLFQELRRRGVDVRVDPDDEHLGDRFPGLSTDATVVVVGGEAEPAPAGGRLVARWDESRPDDRAELEVARARAAERFGDPGLLSPAGAAVVADPDPSDPDAVALRALVAGEGDVERFAASGAIDRAYDRGWYRPETRLESIGFVQEWGRARYDVDGRMFRVYLVPATTS